MSNLLRKQRQAILEKELEVENVEDTENEDVENKATKGDSEDDTFKKRYGDLRRHAAKVEEEMKREIESLKKALENKEVTFPKTEEEVTAWGKQYPDLYNIIETMIMKRERAALASATEKLEKVDKLESELAKERALARLYKAHPDFAEIAASQEFRDWLMAGPRSHVETMYGEGADVEDAIKIVDLYKLTPNFKKNGKTARQDTDAALAQTTKNRSAPTFEGEHIFSESEVARMSEREYLKHEAEIAKQMANGKFIYDKSGAAR